MLLFRCKMIKAMHYLFLSRLFVPILFFLCASAFIYNPKSEKVGTVWKMQIKKESSDF